MRFYIGMGGIGCGILRSYIHWCNGLYDRYYYIDGNPGIANLGYGGRPYLMPGLDHDRPTMRGIGRRAMISELASGKMEEFFSEIREADSVELIFVLSSFGGFGSVAVFPLMDYLEELARGKCRSCTVFAFNESLFTGIHFPNSMLKRFEANTIEFVEEMTAREQPLPAVGKEPGAFFRPGCTFILLDKQDLPLDELWNLLALPDEKLAELNCKDRYYLKADPDSERKPVVLSCTFQDQEKADAIAKALADAGISVHMNRKNIKEKTYAQQAVRAIREARVFLILLSKNAIRSNHVRNEIDRAFSRAKAGLKIIPFLLEDCELDDACRYYFSGYEMISGVTPPFEERVRELVKIIEEASGRISKTGGI